jgi:hypothetical protein
MAETVHPHLYSGIPPPQSCHPPVSKRIEILDKNDRIQQSLKTGASTSSRVEEVNFCVIICARRLCLLLSKT